jgi:uncharacterized membrane protein
MNLARKLRQWQEAGLIDSAGAERIAAFERGGHRPVMLYALGGLGAFAIGIGIISIVAANWSGIGPSTKLGADLALGLALAAGTFHAVRRDLDWYAEVLLLLYYLFTLASLGLVGQVFQSGTPLYRALLLWSAVTLPLMLLGRSRGFGAVWLSGLVATVSTSAVALLRHLGESGTLRQHTLANLAVSLVVLSPFACLALGNVRALRGEREQVGAVFRSAGWSALIVGALCLPFLWYLSLKPGDVLSWSVLVAAAATGALLWALPALSPDLEADARRALGGFCAVSVLTLGIMAIPHQAWPSLAAITHVVQLALLAYVAARLRRLRLFNTLTALLSLRLLTVYFEVFGSMMSTGLGMITGGVLTLVLAWYWRRRSPELAQQLAREGT